MDFAKSVLGREKPHSSITDYVEILTSQTYEVEAYDGIPELVESINLQPTGPGEASRAIRKKLKHGDSHRQYRALVILKALVENCGPKFQSSFADGQLTDAIKSMATDSSLDPKVKKKLTSVLHSWHRQFSGDPRMSAIANLHKSLSQRETMAKEALDLATYSAASREWEQRKVREKAGKLDANRKRKDEERGRQAVEAKKKHRKPFVFEQERPQILTTIANASSAANNLANALTLVNTERESPQTNGRVQECLASAKTLRKQIVRYIQLVENEELIGTLLETNERIINALESYDLLSKPDIDQDVDDVTEQLATANLRDSELRKLQAQQRAEVERSIHRGKEREITRDVHPDLQDLSFGNLGHDQRGLQAPLRPDSRGSDEPYGRGSLSDYSDYESSDEAAHNSRRPSSSKRASHQYGASSSRRLSDVDVSRDPTKGLLATTDDPFADPFADQDVATPGIPEKKAPQW